MEKQRINSRPLAKFALLFSGLFVLVLSFSGCMETDETEVHLIEKISLESLPGASGIGMQTGRFWVIGDDARSCHLYNAKFKLIDTLVIPSMSMYPTKNGRIPKNVKADLEALVVVNDFEVLTFGSGSRPTRESAALIKGSGPYEIEEFTLRGFYKSLRALPEMKGVELNIEAAAIVGDKLYLFNRPNGLMISVHYRDFMRHISEGAPMPKLVARELETPISSGLKAGISGAAFDVESNRLILTASLERTNNAYNDGEILGSYVGSMTMNEYEEPEVSWKEIPFSWEVMKIESVEVVSFDEEARSYELVMTVDNDNGRSHVLRINYLPGE